MGDASGAPQTEAARLCEGAAGDQYRSAPGRPGFVSDLLTLHDFRFATAMRCVHDADRRQVGDVLYGGSPL